MHPTEVAGHPRLDRKLREILSDKVIHDLSLKIKAMENVSQEQLTSIFLDLVDSGIESYLHVEKRRFPWKNQDQIMKEYHLGKLLRRPGRSR